VSKLGRSRRVEFVHIGLTPTLFAGFPDGPSSLVAASVRQATAEIERLVHRHFRGPPGCQVEVKVLGGAGFHDLLGQLRRGDTDLILVGKSETNSAFVEKLARKAPCSVMIVPPIRSVAYRRILVTTDFSDHSARAMEVALAFARARKLKQIICFHGYQIAYGHQRTSLPREQLQKEIETWVQTRFEEFRHKIDFGRLAASFVSRESPVAALAILEHVRQQKSDLLVMGARGMDALAAALLGSTTAQVVRETQIPTLIVKPKGAGRAFLDLLLGGWRT
jgi:nucleotide-binding universal stress UspA family protein